MPKIKYHRVLSHFPLSIYYYFEAAEEILIHLIVINMDHTVMVTMWKLRCTDSTLTVL